MQHKPNLTTFAWIAIALMLLAGVATASDKPAESQTEEATVEQPADEPSVDEAAVEADEAIYGAAALAVDLTAEMPWLSFDEFLRGEEVRLVTSVAGAGGCVSCFVDSSCNPCSLCGPKGGCGIFGIALCCG